MITLDEHGAIVASNPEPARILGRSPEQISGKSDIDPTWGVVTTHGRPVVGVDRPDGPRSWLSLNATPLRRHASGGGPTGRRRP